MNIDIKLKTYEQLQQEVITLNTNSYLKDLKINQLQSNWNSLKELLKEDLKQVYRDAGYRNNIIREILDKMNELEGEDNK